MKTVDLFAGCGGLSEGFIQAGFDIVAAFENWNVAAQCYKENFKHEVFPNDLSDTRDAISIIYSFKPDMIIGGPPCQDFSHAGKRVEGTRANLTISYAEIITTIMPKWFVMENVDRIVNSTSYRIARNIYKNAGYGLTEQILDASFCGVPQKRKRFFCIGLLGANDGFLNLQLSKNLANKPMTLRDYFGNGLGLEFYYRHPRNYSRRAIYSIDETSPTIRGVNRPVPKGYPGHPNDPVPMSPNIRSLTTLERASIQTFPPNFKWIGNKTDTEQMIGNAVPVKLAKYVADAIMEYMKENGGEP